MKEKLLIKTGSSEVPKIEYLGHYKMLDKILDLIDKVSYENKLNLIDKFIELTELINKEKEPTK